MGQKINPIIFRQSITKPDISSWISQKENVASLQHQDLELRNFLSFLLRSQGILLRSYKIQRKQIFTLVIFLPNNPNFFGLKICFVQLRKNMWT